jgi:hypothetical protein
MTIPEAQLETWSHQGSVIQSSTTYATVKTALEDPKATYAARKPKIFLQGSYCNDTNYQQMVLNILNWLFNTKDKSQFLCVNEQYYLLRDNDSVCWPIANGTKFINAVIELWNEWT